MAPPVIEATGLTKHYGATVGLSGLDLAVERGEVFGFLGPNGSGKTTTIRLLLGLIRPTSGTVRLLGQPPSRKDARARVGFVPGDLGLDPRLEGWRTLSFLGSLRVAGTPAPDPHRRSELCERLGLAAADLDRPVRDYSRGMRQKLALVAAFQGDPDVLVLDEPTEGLDPLVREAVLELIAEARRAGRTVFHSSHVLSEVERACTRVGILRAGRLVALERIDALRAATVRTMVVEFVDPVPDDAFALPGLALVAHRPNGVVLRVSGTLDPLLGVLARHPVRHLSFPEPSLEDAFAAYYREPAGAGGRDGRDGRDGGDGRDGRADHRAPRARGAAPASDGSHE